MDNDFYSKSILPHQGIIIKICRSYTDNEEDFKDYYQEVCLHIWKSRNNFNGRSKWTTWIYRISLNVCMTLFKKRKPTEVPFNDSDMVVEADPLEVHRTKDEQIKNLFKAIRKLSKVDRAYILLHLEQKSHGEIAEIMGTSKTNVGTKINRIKTKLKTLYHGN